MSKILGASKVTVRYQVTIPGDVREKLEIVVGDALIFIEENGKVYIATKV
jgi:AbrB family looped-hinge helix DNA binding protein